MPLPIDLDGAPLAEGPPDDLAALTEALEALRRDHPGAVLQRYRGHVPTLHPTAFVAEGAVLVGDVHLAEGASVWFGCVLRADLAAIRIGRGSNIQDGTVIHLGDDAPTEVGEDVTVGHRAVLHGCRVEDACLIGMQATVLDGAVIGEGSLVAAGSVVTAGTIVPPRSLVMGTPGRVRRTLPEDTLATHRAVAAKYRRLVHNHREG